MAKELAKQYDPKGTEDRIYQEWCDKGYFHTQIDRSKKPFTIVMPPPNVTGQLHMGHAMDETWQDILTRYKRMQGYAALWVPGTDHASIATEAKVVAAMREEGLTKEMLGRDGFLERAWAWKNTYGSRIVSQLKKLGCSCDWQRERFTMDEGCSDAVKEVFVRLYDKGLIYRGNRMVNWCPHCNTSISDAEVEYEEKDGSFWHLLYPVKETGEMLELATTRPETMLGDTAVAVNPKDKRYQHMVGKTLVLPRCAGEGVMHGHRVDAPDRLVKGAYGILEPGADCPRVEPAEIDLILVPGTAFDVRGHRIGQGGGYYARYLNRTRAVRVGVCHDFALLSAVPSEAHDARMDIVVTPGRTVIIREETT